LHALEPWVVGRINNIVGQIDKKLRQAAFGGRVITEDRGKGGVT
jgi:hypothetical protein